MAHLVLGRPVRQPSALWHGNTHLLTAPTVINVVCFRHRGRPGMTEDQIKAFNTELMLRLQESGIASPSDTTIHGRHSLRAAIVNHRCRPEDIDLLVAALHQTGAELLAEG